MIVTDVGGLAEIVPHNKVGFVVAGEAQKIAESIRSFYVDKRGAEFITNIKTEKKKYAWDKMIDVIFSLCNTADKN
jgi:glycosyltransferase involved in cell wall biosynthesis